MTVESLIMDKNNHPIFSFQWMFNDNNSIGSQPIPLLKLKQGCYGVNQPYQFKFEILTSEELKWEPNISGFLSIQNAAQRFYFKGAVTHFTVLPSLNDQRHYCITLCSSITLLKLSQTDRVFYRKTVIEILQVLLAQIRPDLKTDVFQLQRSYEKKPIVIQYQETDYSFFIRLLNESKIFFYEDCRQLSSSIVFFDDWSLMQNGITQTLDFVPLSHMVRENSTVFDFQSLCQKGKEYVKFKTDDARLMVGSYLFLQHHPVSHFNRTYRVIAMEYHRKALHDEWHYYNECEALPINQVEISLSPQKRIQNHLILAQIISHHGDQVDLDEQGRYLVKYGFEINEQHNEVSSLEEEEGDGYRLHMMQPYVGNHSQRFSYGLHFPLKPGVWVLVGFENGDLENPFIVGAVNGRAGLNDEVRDEEIALIYEMSTQQGRAMILSDVSHHPTVELCTAHKDQFLCLNASENLSSIHMANKKGSIVFETADNWYGTSQQSQVVKVGRDYMADIVLSQELLTEEGSIKLETGQSLKLSSGQSMQLQSMAASIWMESQLTMCWKSQQQLYWQAHDDLILNLQDSLTLRAKELVMQSAEQMTLGSAINIHQGHVHFAQVIFAAPLIIKEMG
jgi:uncharacterized protein involved in type VI secretion and phage assembly